VPQRNALHKSGIGLVQPVPLCFGGNHNHNLRLRQRELRDGTRIDVPGFLDAEHAVCGILSDKRERRRTIRKRAAGDERACGIAIGTDTMFNFELPLTAVIAEPEKVEDTMKVGGLRAVVERVTLNGVQVQ
jgi:hypothetical protein